MQLTGHKVLIPPTPATDTDLSKRVVPVLFVLCVTLCLLAVESFSCFILLVVLLLYGSCLAIWSSCPVNTQRHSNVVSTSQRRHDVAATSKQRYYDVMCLLGWWVRESWLLRISRAFGLCTVYLDLFAHLGVIGRLCSVIVVLPRHLQYYFTAPLMKISFV